MAHQLHPTARQTAANPASWAMDGKDGTYDPKLSLKDDAPMVSHATTVLHQTLGHRTKYTEDQPRKGMKMSRTLSVMTGACVPICLPRALQTAGRHEQAFVLGTVLAGPWPWHVQRSLLCLCSGQPERHFQS